MPKYIFITGGVLSSLGKGLTAAAIGTLLENMGYRVSFIKLDPYLNVDPGTMNPYQHGEVFVTEDGAETDLDLGHYERFTHVSLQRHNSVTAGQLYARLIEKERRGDFLGGTIQTVPHLTDEIKQVIQRAAEGVDCIIVEVGGTVGDIEGLPFIEAIRQMGLPKERNNCLYLHLTYVPYLEVSGELKTKPTQHSVKELCSLGIQPDILICRSQYALPEDIKKKIALFTNVEESSIISAPDLATIYELPLVLAKEQLPKGLARYLNVAYQEPNLQPWRTLITTLQALQHNVTIAIVGKYVALKDAYKSLYEALSHAQSSAGTKTDLIWIDAEEVTADTVDSLLRNIDGIVIPGGFGDRGIEGKLCAARYARENKIPFLGICLGMQIALIEFARHVLRMTEAHSTEFMPTTQHPVIDLMADQKSVINKGGTMRLGAQVCRIQQNSKAFSIYDRAIISERHRHRFEFNTRYVPAFEAAGLIVSGTHETTGLPEIIEIPKHPYFIGCQFHPELQSKPFAPHALFVNLLQAAWQKKIGIVDQPDTVVTGREIMQKNLAENVL
jgi:CTP synthase